MVEIQSLMSVVCLSIYNSGCQIFFKQPFQVKFYCSSDEIDVIKLRIVNSPPNSSSDRFDVTFRCFSWRLCRQRELQEIKRAFDSAELSSVKYLRVAGFIRPLKMNSGFITFDGGCKVLNLIVGIMRTPERVLTLKTSYLLDHHAFGNIFHFIHGKESSCSVPIQGIAVDLKFWQRCPSNLTNVCNRWKIWMNIWPELIQSLQCLRTKIFNLAFTLDKFWVSLEWWLIDWFVSSIGSQIHRCLKVKHEARYARLVVLLALRSKWLYQDIFRWRRHQQKASRDEVASVLF